MVVELTFNTNEVRPTGSMRQALRQLFYCFGASDSDFDGAELIVGELLGNAVRHAPGTITIHLTWAEDEAVFTIHDRGPGFVLDPKLPDEFTPGGRGLYIVRKLAREVRVDRDADGGASVTARLPVYKPGDHHATSAHGKTS